MTFTKCQNKIKGEKQMKTEELQNLFKDALAKVKDETSYGMMENDISYQKSLKRYGEACDRYSVIKDSLGREVQDVIDELITSNEMNWSDACDIYYLAGIKDTLQLLDSYELIKKDIQ